MYINGIFINQMKISEVLAVNSTSPAPSSEHIRTTAIASKNENNASNLINGIPIVIRLMSDINIDIIAFVFLVIFSSIINFEK